MRATGSRISATTIWRSCRSAPMATRTRTAAAAPIPRRSATRSIPRTATRAWSSRRNKARGEGGRMLVVTTNDIAGYKVTRYLGVVRGITVRSRSIVGNIGASIQALFGGNITLYTSLCEQARADAYELMAEHAVEMGANAIVAMRYDANEVAAGITEVLAYGTAVVVEP